MEKLKVPVFLIFLNFHADGFLCRYMNLAAMNLMQKQTSIYGMCSALDNTYHESASKSSYILCVHSV